MLTIDLLHRAVPTKHTEEGFCVLSGESPIHPEGVKKYLEGKFGGDALPTGGKSLPPLGEI